MNMKLLLKHIVSLIVVALLVLPLTAMAQTGSDDEGKEPLSEEQLTQLLAPVALYPDELIAQVLMAATYPLEIVMADRWVQQNAGLNGDALAAALEKKPWDPSVKSLINFPSVLSMLSQKLDLTTKLGDAFLEQKDDVMDTIQELRQKAAAAGNLATTKEQKVVVEDETIIIEPAEPSVIYVPTYDPFLVYGPWWYPDYPPFYFFPPYPGSMLFSFGFGFRLGLPWGYAWGRCSWHSHDVVINVNRNHVYNSHINRPRYIQNYERRGTAIRDGHFNWQHDSDHRRGVAYKDKSTARQFGQLSVRTGEPRRDSRGFNTPDRRDRTAPQPWGRDIVPPGAGGQAKVPVSASPNRGAPPPASRESVFTGGENGAAGVRKSSERGSRSFGGGSINRVAPAARSDRGAGTGSVRSSGGGPPSGGPRGGGQGARERR